jgi:hypothetical protein
LAALNINRLLLIEEIMETLSKKDRDKVSRDKYRQSDKYKATEAAYRKTDKYKTYHAAAGKTDRAKSYQHEYAKTDKAKASRKAYYNTVNGYLRHLYRAMTTRCKNKARKTYDNIENKFQSAEHLIWYVVEVLKVDPRGLVCHRIDNDGHYEEGNIEFLTPDEHVATHVEMRKNG